MPRSPRLAHKARPVMQATLNQFSNVIQSTLALWTPPYYGHIGNMGSSSITRQNELQVNFFSNLNPCPSLPSVATDNRKQFQCINIVLNNKTVSLFLEFNWLEDTFLSVLAGHGSFQESISSIPRVFAIPEFDCKLVTSERAPFHLQH